MTIHSWQEDEHEGEQEDEQVGEEDDEDVDNLLASLDKEMGASAGADGRRRPSPAIECARLRTEI